MRPRHPFQPLLLSHGLSNLLCFPNKRLCVREDWQKVIQWGGAQSWSRMNTPTKGKACKACSQSSSTASQANCVCRRPLLQNTSLDRVPTIKMQNINGKPRPLQFKRKWKIKVKTLVGLQEATKGDSQMLGWRGKSTLETKTGRNQWEPDEHQRSAGELHSKLAFHQQSARTGLQEHPV